MRCLTHWRWLLDGTTDLIVYTDSKALVTGKLLEESQPAWASHRMARWISRIASTRAGLRHHPASARLVIAVDALTRRPDYVEGTAKDMARWIAELSELHAARKQRAQVTRPSLHVLTGVRSASRGVRCVQTIVVATSPLERIQAGMLGDNDKELRRLGCEKRNGLWTRFGRIVVPQDADLRADLIREVHDVGHPGRLATYQMLRRHAPLRPLDPYLVELRIFRTVSTGRCASHTRVSAVPPRQPLACPPECARTESSLRRAFSRRAMSCAGS